MQFLKLDPTIPFLQKPDSIPDTVRNAALVAPYNKPSYRSERRLSVWLFAAPDMSAGAAPKFTPAWRNQHLEDFVTSRGYDIAQLGLTHYSAGGGIMPHRDTTFAKPGMALGVTLFGDATFFMWSNALKQKPTSNNASLIVTLQDGDVYEFHNKYIHAGWSHDQRRITLNAWKLRDDWKTAFRVALRTTF
jgi:hypothetical protein